MRVLEDLNLMNAFGAWALQRACEDAAKWPMPVKVGVNVSTRQIETLVESVRRALASSGLPAERLELEITETAALAPATRCRARWRRCAPWASRSRSTISAPAIPASAI